MPGHRKRYLHLRDRYARSVYDRAVIDCGNAAERYGPHVIVAPYLRTPLRPFRTLASADPTPNKAFLQRLIVWYLAEKIRIEDLRHVKSILSTFLAYRRALPQERRDINRYQSPGDVEEMLTDLLAAGDVGDGRHAGPQQTDLEGVPTEVLEETEMVASGSDWMLIEIQGYKAAAWWAAPTSWCTKEQDAFRFYDGESPLRIMLRPSGRIQFHTQSDQIMDRYDRRVPVKDLDWPMEARAAAATAMAGDMLLSLDVPMAKPFPKQTFLLELAGITPEYRGNTPMDVFDEGYRAWAVGIGAEIFLAVVDDVGIRIAKMKEDAAKQDADIANDSFRTGDIHTYRSTDDWAAATETDRSVFAMIADRYWDCADSTVQSIQAFRVVARDRRLAQRLVDGKADDGIRETVCRRLDLLSCAIANPEKIAGAEAEFVDSLMNRDGVADVVATSLTAMFSAGHPLIEGIAARSSERARKVMASIEPCYVDAFHLPRTAAKPVASLRVRPRRPGEASEEERRRKGTGAEERRLLLRAVRTSASPCATEADVVAVMDGIQRTMGPDHVHIQRGYLLAAVPIRDRTARLVERLLDDGHLGLASTAPIEHLPLPLVDRLFARPDTPIILDVATITPKATTILAGYREAMWGDIASRARFETGTETQRAGAAFTAAFLKEKRIPWMQDFWRATHLALGRRDTILLPDDIEERASGKPVLGGSEIPNHLIRGDHFAGIMANHYGVMEYRNLVTLMMSSANPAFSAMLGADDLRGSGWTDTRMEMMARDWRNIEIAQQEDEDSGRLKFFVENHLRRAINEGDYATRDAIFDKYIRMGGKIEAIEERLRLRRPDAA